MMRVDVEDPRFWSKVCKTETCWVWTGAISEGYGNYRIRAGVSERAHRIAWCLFNGDVPAGKMVLHHCDNRACVRPDHLYAGDYKDNMADAVARHRHVGHAPHSQRRKIHELRASGLSYRQICKIVRVSPATLTRYFGGGRHV